MQWMSLSLLLRKRMSNETLEVGDKWTQEELQKITKKLEKWTTTRSGATNKQKQTEEQIMNKIIISKL